MAQPPLPPGSPRIPICLEEAPGPSGLPTFMEELLRYREQARRLAPLTVPFAQSAQPEQPEQPEPPPTEAPLPRWIVTSRGSGPTRVDLVEAPSGEAAIHTVRDETGDLDELRAHVTYTVRAYHPPMGRILRTYT